MTVISARCVAAAVCCALLGCNPGPQPVDVTGLVTQDGSPLTSGKIVMTSVDGRPPAVGQIQPDGAFVLSTHKPRDGAHPGRYRVIITTDLETDGRKARATFRPPRDTLVTVEAEGENRLRIDVSRAAGWQVTSENLTNER